MLNKEKRPKSEYACDGGAVIEPEKVTLFKDNRRNKVTCAANIEVYFELTRHPIMYYNRRPVYSDRIAERYLVWNKTKWVIVDTQKFDPRRTDPFIPEKQSSIIYPYIAFDVGTGGYTPDGAKSQTHTLGRVYDNNKLGRAIHRKFSEKVGIHSQGQCPDPRTMIKDPVAFEGITGSALDKLAGVFYQIKFKDYTKVPFYMGPPGYAVKHLVLNESPSCTFPRCIYTAFKSNIL